MISGSLTRFKRHPRAELRFGGILVNGDHGNAAGGRRGCHDVRPGSERHGQSGACRRWADRNLQALRGIGRRSRSGGERRRHAGGLQDSGSAYERRRRILCGLHCGGGRRVWVRRGERAGQARNGAARGRRLLRRKGCGARLDRSLGSVRGRGPCERRLRDDRQGASESGGEAVVALPELRRARRPALDRRASAEHRADDGGHDGGRGDELGGVHGERWTRGLEGSALCADRFTAGPATARPGPVLTSQVRAVTAKARVLRRRRLTGGWVEVAAPSGGPGQCCRLQRRRPPWRRPCAAPSAGEGRERARMKQPQRLSGTAERPAPSHPAESAGRLGNSGLAEA